MINPAELVDNLVALLRSIPDLVAEMDGDPKRIYAYHDQYPKQASLAQAIHTMPAPAVMAVWQAGRPARSTRWMFGSTRSRCTCVRARQTRAIRQLRTTVCFI